ncbi:MAG: YdcH family protein [Alphaproteobacteria bacterium]|nr:YdcH family protein [Alphaproteobacteria bacterium]
MSDTSVTGQDQANSSTEDRIQLLQQKHSELDEALQREEARPMPDSLTIATLKRQKLAIKDELAQLNNA